MSNPLATLIRFGEQGHPRGDSVHSNVSHPQLTIHSTSLMLSIMVHYGGECKQAPPVVHDPIRVFSVTHNFHEPWCKVAGTLCRKFSMYL